MPNLHVPNASEANGIDTYTVTSTSSSAIQFVDSTSSNVPVNPPADTAVVAFFSGTEGALYTWSPAAQTWRDNSPVTQQQVTGGMAAIVTDTTYYVRKDGNDSNDGTANTSAKAWLTIQHALTWLTSNVSIKYGTTVTLQIGDGTYNESVIIPSVIGGGTLAIQGNTSNKDAVVINGTGYAVTSFCSIGPFVSIAYVKLTGGGGFRSAYGGTLSFGNVDFGAVTGSHMWAERGSTITATANYTISGGAAWHMWASQCSVIKMSGATNITLTNTPAFSNGFAFGDSLGMIFAVGMTYSGSATGPRYTVSICGCIYTNGGGNTYFPGSGSYTVALGGQYA